MNERFSVHCKSMKQNHITNLVKKVFSETINNEQTESFFDLSSILTVDWKRFLLLS